MREIKGKIRGVEYLFTSDYYFVIGGKRWYVSVTKEYFRISLPRLGNLVLSRWSPGHQSRLPKAAWSPFFVGFTSRHITWSKNLKREEIWRS